MNKSRKWKWAEPVVYLETEQTDDENLGAWKSTRLITTLEVLVERFCISECSLTICL